MSRHRSSDCDETFTSCCKHAHVGFGNLKNYNSWSTRFRPTGAHTVHPITMKFSQVVNMLAVVLEIKKYINKKLYQLEYPVFPYIPILKFCTNVDQRLSQNGIATHAGKSQYTIFFILNVCNLGAWARWLKRQGPWQRAGRPGFDPGCRRGGDFSSLLRVQTDPGVHSHSYKMSTEGFPRR